MSARYDTRRWWKQRAILLQKRLDKARANQTQALDDHDALEAELKALLTPTLTEDPNPSLLALSHHDLALLADQWRVKQLNS